MENENIQEKKINKEVSPATVEEVNINDDLYDEFQIDVFGQAADQMTEDLIITYKFQERKASR